MIEKQLLCEKEAARYLGMSISYLQKDRVNGAIGTRIPGPTFIRLGRTIRYRKCDLDSWIENNTISRTHIN